MKMKHIGLNFCGRWPDFLVDALNQTGSITLEEANVLAYLVSYMDTLQMETYEAAIQMLQEEKIDVPPTIKELLNLCYNLDCYEFGRGSGMIGNWGKSAWMEEFLIGLTGFQMMWWSFWIQRR